MVGLRDLFLSFLLTNDCEILTHGISLPPAAKIKPIIPQQDLCQGHKVIDLFCDLRKSTLSQVFTQLWFQECIFRVLILQEKPPLSVKVKYNQGQFTTNAKIPGSAFIPCISVIHWVPL